MPALSTTERSRLVWYAEWYLNKFRQEFVAQLRAEFPAIEHVREIADLEKEVRDLIQTLTGEAGHDVSGGLDDPWNPLIKRVILAYRLDKATELERLREKTSHLEILEHLDSVVRPLDELAARRWFRETEPRRVPHLADYLDLERIEKKASQELPFPPREYDEKFHILQAPSLFLRDLHYYREKCALRGTTVAVAFLDIDQFKEKFNSRHGETKVDRNVLPRFMRSLEAHVAFHGHAYRQGGDEYMLLLPGLSANLAITFLDELRLRQAHVEYPDVPERTTVSIGLCVVGPDCPLTDRELRDKANQAEGFAKRTGRNCMATFRGPQFDEESLYIAAPAREVHLRNSGETKVDMSEWSPLAHAAAP
jgi:diguanylate cyclase (GGDEF)-like protein